MTNDLTTLSGSLTECKDQLISELANQGVTATYDPTTGLLGLIAKISEITPVVQTLTLTSNKSILSYADSESATLTATHSGGSGKTVEIYNAVTGVKIGDATDNNDGTYTYTYSASGYGDISMTATSGALESNAISIEDCYDIITGLTDETSKFGSSIALRNNGASTIVYDSTNQWYTWTNTVGSSESMIPLSNAKGLNSIEIIYDAYLTTHGSSILGLTTYHNSSNWERLSNLNYNTVVAKNVNGSFSETDAQLGTDIKNLWVHVKFTITNNTITKKITYNDTVIQEATENIDSTWFDSNTEYGLPVVWGTDWSNNSRFKNFKIKAI